MLTEHDSTWVDVVDDLVWLQSGKEFTWVSERDGWKHVYAVSRDGKSVRLVTKGNFDVLEVKGIDDKGGWLYYVASPDNPTQKYLFRTRLDGKGTPQRISPREEPGTHAYDRSPNYKYAIENYSSLGNPPLIRLVRLPGNQVIRTLVDNARSPCARRGPPPPVGRVADRAGGRRLEDARRAPEAGGLRLHPEVPACCSSCMAGRGTPRSRTSGADTTCGTRCSRRRATWWPSWTTAAPPRPLGRAWRKAIYGQLGVLETQDQAAAATALRAAAVRGPEPGRHLGMELRRVHDAERAVPAPRAVPDGRGRLAR